MPSTQATFDTHSPSDGRVIATFRTMGQTEVNEVVDRARIAASWWGTLTFGERRRYLMRFKSIIARRASELAELVHQENGKPTDDALLEILLSIEHTDWAAKNAEKTLKQRNVRPGMLTLNQDARIAYQPLGVIGIIGPWNYPVFTPIGSLSYALAAGNAVVFKPSEYTTSVGKWLVDAINEAVPEQPIAQLITGTGETGAALCTSGVDKISFTGSAPTGRKVLAACATSLTPVSLELGGKDAVLVDKSANLEKAADAVTFGAFHNAGQTCAGVERVYVHEDVYSEFLDRVASKTRALTPGNKRDSSYGPMTMPTQIDVVRRHVLDAIARGGEPIVGGPESVGESVISPILLTKVPEDSSAITEETFGPTIVVNPVRDLDEAVDRANASSFGLGASVFSRDRQAMERAASRLRTGMVTMNSWVMNAGVPALPWGGVGDSGFGRIHGADGLREFTRVKSTVRERFPLPISLTSFNRHPKAFETVRKVYSVVHGR
jgi:acyl-CoA reductase-like NAD-dependent aldehyde dehydrogenase